MCEITTDFILLLCIGHGAESAILVLKQGETCVSGDFLQGNVAQSEVFAQMLAQHNN